MRGADQSDRGFNMKRFMLLHFGFKKPTPEMLEACLEKAMAQVE